jgi:hypothetical protein
MKKYFFGGYYLMKLVPIKYGDQVDNISYTCSNCINHSLLGNWSYSWTTNNNSYLVDVKDDYAIDDSVVNAIRQWADQTFEDKRIGWIDLFNNFSAVQEYRTSFFTHLIDLKIMSIYFEEKEVTELLDAFQPLKGNGAIGLYENLQNETPEEQIPDQQVLGYDLIGIELDGSFHSFHCHSLAGALMERFGLTLNEYGLLNDTDNWSPVVEYMNDEGNGFEPVPWFYCKVKIFHE